MQAGPFTSALRIFLSVDIVGSTAFKQAANKAPLERSDSSHGDASLAEPWFSPIAQFYRGFERTFFKEWSVCAESCGKLRWPTGDAPELWKSVGDELVYTKLLTDHREALTTVNAWMAAVRSYRLRLKEQFKSLDLKSTAWVAGFPVHNAEVIFRSTVTDSEDEDDDVLSNLALLRRYYSSSEKAGLTRDFIGPAIDTGFRISHLSSPRRFVISVELALMLVHATRTQPPAYAYEKLRYFFEGRQSLKGVFGGIPYPVFWIDMRPSPELEGSEDKLNEREPLNTDFMLEFCHEFIKASDGYCFTPYIVGNVDQTFNEVPLHHTRRLEDLRAYLDLEGQKRVDEQHAGLEKIDDEPEEGSKTESLRKVLLELDPASRDPRDE